MKEQNFFIHKSVPEDEAKRLKPSLSYLKGYRRGSFEKIALKKTPEQIAVIGLFNEYIKEEQRDLGLSPSESVEGDDIHYLTSEDYMKHSSTKSGFGESNMIAKDVLISAEGIGNRIKSHEVLLHEMVHVFSPSNIYLKKEGSDLEMDTSLGLSKPAFGGDVHFNGLNELMTQMITLRILVKHKEELFKKLEVTNEEFEEYRKSPFGYEHLFRLFGMIFNRIAEETKISESEVERNLKKAYFQGSLYPLRSIEKIWGPGSLRVLASLGSNLHEEVHGDRFDPIPHFQYFSSETAEDRHKYMRQIFGFEEREDI